MPRVSRYAVQPYDVFRCARHDAERKDASLTTFYYCQSCADEVRTNALHNTAAAHEGIEFAGHCALCNEARSVKLRQWFLCTTCERVLRSMGRGRVAARFVHDWWAENAKAIAPGLSLEETEPPVIRAVGEGPKTAPIPDFTAIDTATKAEVFTLELKTGRSNLSGMSQFQLDTTDCDDILSVVRTKLVPGYVLHAMVVEQFDAPTSYFKAVGLWWTDVFQMTDAFQSVRRRQTEQRMAAFFNKKCFHPMSEFLPVLTGHEYEELAERLRSEGVPVMYRLS